MIYYIARKSSFLTAIKNEGPTFGGIRDEIRNSGRMGNDRNFNGGVAIKMHRWKRDLFIFTRGIRNGFNIDVKTRAEKQKKSYVTDFYAEK